VFGAVGKKGTGSKSYFFQIERETCRNKKYTLAEHYSFPLKIPGTCAGHGFFWSLLDSPGYDLFTSPWQKMETSPWTSMDT